MTLCRTLIFLIIISSCGNDKDPNASYFTEGDFHKPTNLESEEINIDSISDHLLDVGPVYLLDDHLIILDRKSEGPMHVLDLDKSKYLGIYGKKGKGVGEIMMPLSISKIDEESFLLMDVGLRKVLEYNLDTLLAENKSIYEKKINQKGVSSYVELHKDHLFYLDELNIEHRLFRRELNNEDSNTGYGIVPNLVKTGESDFVKSTAASAIMKSINGLFVFIYKQSPRIEIFDYENQSWKTIIAPDNYKINYDVNLIDGYSLFVFNDKTKNAFIDLALTENYIYTLYSGEATIEKVNVETNTIFVFDYDGNPVKTYKLDKNISFFDVKNDSTIYAMSIDIYPQILKFNIK